MQNKINKNELVVTENPNLENISQICAVSHYQDVNSAIREGAVLLGFSSCEKIEADDDGFTYLIGLHKGVEVTSHLSCFFSS